MSSITDEQTRTLRALASYSQNFTISPNAMQDLRNRGLVEWIEMPDEGTCWGITEAGRAILRKVKP